MLCVVLKLKVEQVVGRNAIGTLGVCEKNLAMQFVELSKFVRMLFEWIVLKCNNFIYYFTGTGLILEVTVTMFILSYFHRDCEAQS